MTNKEKFILAFHSLGLIIEKIAKEEELIGYELGITDNEYQKLKQTVEVQQQKNAWFTKENVQKSLNAIASLLNKDKLETWTQNYTFASSPKKVAIIMAGNIPIVGFHDMLCVVLSGHCAICKMSSNDNTLLPVIVEVLRLLSPQLNERIVCVNGTIGEVDAVIATGSNNSSLYFEQYFGKYPHIFRKNRTSIAILNGTESLSELTDLGADILDYFGLGCRNVSHLIVPKNYKFPKFIQAIATYQNIIFHNKYANNYDYNKAIYLMNKIPIIDNGFLLLRETQDIHSPLSVVNYHFYENQQEVENYLQKHKNSIQAIVGHNYIPFGKIQMPTLTDYADNVNTMEWLSSLNTYSRDSLF